MGPIKTHLYATTVSTIYVTSLDGEHVWYETMVFGPYGDEAVTYSRTAEDACIAHNSICKAIACATGAEYESAQIHSFMNREILRKMREGSDQTTRKVDPESRGMPLAIRKKIFGI